MSGAGNDFVVIDNRSAYVKDGAALAKELCDRHWGVGADGLLLLESSDLASYRMMYYNSDGSYGGMCGNGGRCIAMFAYLKNIAPKNHTFDALGHIYSVAVSEKDVVLDMKDPTLLKLNRILFLGKKKISYHSVDTGAPHIVIDLGEFNKNKILDDLDVQRWGEMLRWHKKFAPKGTNVNFIKLSENNVVHLRTYERGVEAETLACGTGSTAVAIIAAKKWKLKTPITVIPTSKVPLMIDFNEENRSVNRVKLKGPAIITFSGNVDIG
jgi:diaminopimelate epimerase